MPPCMHTWWIEAGGAGVLIGLAATVIGVYRVSHRIMTSFADVFVLFIGGSLFIASVSCVLGWVALCNITGK